MNISILRPYTLVSLALLSLACSADPEPTATSSTTSGVMYCDPMPLMATTCNGVICHGSPGTPPKVGTDLFNAPAGQTLGQSLIGKPANYNLVANPTNCPTANPEQLINASAPAESLILKKITGNHACGVKMPNVMNKTLTQADIDCFVSWVNGQITENGLTVTGSAVTSAVTSGSTSTSTVTSAVTSGSTSTSTTGAATTTTTTTTGATTIGTTTGAGGATSTATSSSTTGDLGPIPPATFETVTAVLTMNTLNCISSDCHGGVEERIDFRPEASPPLIERLTTWNSDVCGKPVVTPGNPEQSALLDVLTTGCGEVVPNCLVGTQCIPQMPLACTPGFDCIPPEYIEAIRQWIVAGALVE